MNAQSEDADDDTTGRRRAGSETDEAILEATLELLDEVGLGGLTVEGVAKRARVAKTTIYRRWDDKYMLAIAALDRIRPVLQFPDTGSLREDLLTLFRTVERRSGVKRLRQTSAMLVHALTHDQRFPSVYWTTFGEPRRAQIADIFTRAQDRGELSAAVDTDVLVDIIEGSIFYQGIRPSDESFTARMNRIVTELIALLDTAPSDNTNPA